MNPVSQQPNVIPPTLQGLLQQGGVWNARINPQPLRPVVSSGYPELDARLPAGGWQAGDLCEIWHDSPGQGELSLILPALATLSQQPRWILWVGAPAIPNAAALQQAGVRIEHMLLVHPRNYREAVWCMEEGLRSGHCSAVLGWPLEWHKNHIRRLQVAASEHNSYCWLWPRTGFDASGSPAALRLGVQRPHFNQLQVECFKRRGSWPAGRFMIELPVSA